MNSKLEIIGKRTFCNNSIVSILLPRIVKKKWWKLNLEIIEKSSFANSQLGFIYKPNNVVELEKEYFKDCKKLYSLSSLMMNQNWGW